MADDDGTDKIQQLAQETLRAALWKAAYHESSLWKGRRKLGLVRALLEQAAIDVSDEGEGGDAEDAETVDEFAAALLADAVESARYHESSLITASQNVGIVKALLGRAHCEVDAQEIERMVREARAEAEERAR
jgi:hypothetical protein